MKILKIMILFSVYFLFCFDKSFSEIKIYNLGSRSVYSKGYGLVLDTEEWECTTGHIGYNGDANRNRPIVDIGLVGVSRFPELPMHFEFMRLRTPYAGIVKRDKPIDSYVKDFINKYNVNANGLACMMTIGEPIQKENCLIYRGWGCSWGYQPTQSLGLSEIYVIWDDYTTYIMFSLIGYVREKENQDYLFEKMRNLVIKLDE